MTGLNLRLIIPVGRLAIDAFFPASKALEKIIGQRLKYSRALVVPLPHPSGLSRWYQNQEHRALIYHAPEMIGGLNLTSTPLPRCWLNIDKCILDEPCGSVPRFRYSGDYLNLVVMGYKLSTISNCQQRITSNLLKAS